ncbi:hypothetical protein [uncultured Aquimarina sp.]|uniref:hypothetical protein n=1 Tax=uncultured Aquimarina sp. TaxID=575652 RepID=UPI0026339013|nr:hypothetical protein [uncultured Aquimarina sp.]
MRKVIFYLLFTFYVSNIVAQIDAGNLLGLPTATDFTEINGIVGPEIGALVYNLDDDQVYRFTSTGWEIINGENLYNSDGTLTANRAVNMATNTLQFNTDLSSGENITLRRTNNSNQIGLAFRNSGNAFDAAIILDSGTNNGISFNTIGNVSSASTLGLAMKIQDDGELDLPEYGEPTPNFEGTATATKALGVNADGSVVELNTTKSSRIFYPPSIAIDASTISANTAAPGDESVNLYDQYIEQFTLANAATSASSTGSPGTIPTYLANELYYYVTFFDPAVFANVAIDANGEMTYDIINTPADFNSLINVVFVVR